MPTRFHLVMDIWHCSACALDRPEALVEFMNYLAYLSGQYLIKGPITTQRDKESGVSAFISLRYGHATIHTYTGRDEIAFDMYSSKHFDMIAVRDYVIRYFKADISTAEVINLAKEGKETIRCEMAGCRQKALREWGGRLVCQDHFIELRDKEKGISWDDYQS